MKTLILLLICFFSVTFAFQTNILEINVTDQSLALIPNVTARLKKDDKIVQEITDLQLQKVVFSNLKLGEYYLEIEASGFKQYTEKIEIKTSLTQLNIKLEIAEIVENVTVEQSRQDKNLDPREGAFTNFLTKQEIDALPDDPLLLKKMLQDKFGADAEFLVDSFSSNGLPPKSRIASIKVNQSSFDAEFHKIGIAIIEITTKPASKFFGFLSFDFNDESLNARQSFSAVRYPQQNKSFSLILWGPIKKDKLAYTFFGSNTNSFNTATVVAKTPNGNVNNLLRTPQSQQYFEGRLNYNRSQYQTINVSYTFNRNRSDNLGIGGFNLSERAFNLNSVGHQLRYSQVGNVGERFYNEFRLQFRKETSETLSANENPAIIVLDAFSRGGAGNNNQTDRANFTIANNLLWGIKNHALKIGGILEYEYLDSDFADNKNGTFIFSSLDNFMLNKSSIFTQRIENRRVKFSQVQLGTFIQDDIRISKSLMLSLGLRYEWQNNLKDNNNFSPRIGFAWSPSLESKTTIRGGVGFFYNWLDTQTLSTIKSQDANQPSEIIILNPNFPNLNPTGFSQILQTSYWQNARDLKNPYFLLGQLGVQRQLSDKSSLKIQYVYQKGIHQFRSRDVNAPINLVRPNADLGRILQLESTAFMVTNSLRLDFNVALTKTTYLTSNYRLSKSLSDTNGYFGLPVDSNNLRIDRSTANNDQRHFFYNTFIWSLPKRVRFSLIHQLNSSLPFTITTGKDDNGDTIFNDRPKGIQRNSERGKWNQHFNVSLSWQVNLGEKNSNGQVTGDSNAEFFSGKSIKFVINASNIFNQTNFTNYVGVQTSPFFRQPTSADNPRRIDFGLRFSF